MVKNEFAELFAGLTKEEFARFGNFIHSPFFEIPNRIVKLFELIDKKYDSINNDPLSREEISEGFYPGKNYEDTQLNIRKLISEFKKYYDEFLSGLEFRQQDFHRSLFLLKQLAKLRRYDEFDKLFDKTNLAIENRSVKDEEYYQHKLMLLAEAYKLEGSSFKKFEDDLAFKIQELVDLYYYSYKMFLFQRIEAKTIVMNRQMESFGKYYNDIVKDIELNKEYYKDHPEIYARYLHLSFSLNKSEKTDITNIISYLNDITEKLKIDCYYYYSDMIGYCGILVNNGFAEYEKNILEITQVMDRKGLFLNHIILDHIFKTIIESYFGTKQYDEALKFLNKYKDKPEFSSNKGYINISFAKTFFFMHNYAVSRKYLIKVHYNDFVHYVDAKLIEARISYEEKLFNDVFAILDTVKKYIKQHKEIGQMYKQSYLNFINILNDLIRIYESKPGRVTDDFEIENLLSKTNTTKFLYGAGWLLEKIAEIKKAG